MKKLITNLAAMLFAAGIFAQAPQKMSYQAVIRNNSNILLSNATVGMKISILQGSASGTSVYSETQTPATNANGLVSVEIGGGTVVSGTFAAIDWSAGPYFIKTETDPSGGTTYTITGTSQLLSVPYALYAKTAGNSINGNLTLSVSKATNISSSYTMMDTISIKAGKVVTIKGYTQTTGSECTIYLYNLTNNQWVDQSFTVSTIYEEQGIGFASYSGTNGEILPFSTTKKEFTTCFLPTFDFQLQIQTKELTSTSANGVGEAAVIVIQ